MQWGANNWQSDPPDFDAAQELGLRFFRISLSTDAPTSSYDGLMRQLVSRHVEVTPFLTRAEGGVTAPPRTGAERREWAEGVAALVRRYGRNGSFWIEHPDLPYMPIRHWEVWNEPDHRTHWEGARDPGHYRWVFEVAERAVHGVDPRADVLFGGLAGNRKDFFQRVQSQGAAPLNFSAVGFHTYPRTPERALGLVRRFRREVDSSGHPEASIWVNEIGRNPGPGDARQATFLDRFMTLSRENERVLRLGPTFVFSLRDHPTGEHGRYGRMGLLRPDYTRRLAFEAVKRQISRDRFWLTPSDAFGSALPQPILGPHLFEP